jgi:hypothetical protein
MTVLPSNADQVPYHAAFHRPPHSQPYWAREQEQKNSAFGTVAAFGIGGATIGAAGFMKIGGQRIWSKYANALQFMEDISPGRFFRTFGYSEVTSPFSAPSSFNIERQYFTRTIQTPLGAKDFPNWKTRRFMASQLGMGMSELEASGAFFKGLEFRRTGATFGTLSVAGGGPMLSQSALAMQYGGSTGAGFVDWYARASGQKLGMGESIRPSLGRDYTAVTTPGIKLDKVLGIPITDTSRLWLNKARTVGRMQRAYWAGQIGRLNKLLEAPVDFIPGIKPLTKKLGIKFSVKAGTATQMLGRYVGKGMAIAAGFTAIQYASYLRGKSEGGFTSGAVGAGLGAGLGYLWKRSGKAGLIGGLIGAGLGSFSRFDQGIIEGGASMWAEANMAGARLSQRLGMTEGARRQEELMPGVTKTRTLVGLAGTGAVAGGLAGWIQKLSFFKQKGIQEASKFLLEQEELIGARAAKLKGIRGGLSKILGRGAEKGIRNKLMMRGGRLGALAGAGLFAAFAGAASIMTGSMPGIFASKRTPEELGALYSGETEVAIRKGRFWEFGRCLTKSNTYKLYDGSIKTSEDIKIGDILVGREYRKAKVINIYTRQHCGLVYKFSTGYDRDNKTEVTGNHMIPVRRCGEINEIEASRIQANDWVEIPYKQLNNNVDTINAVDIINEPIWALKDKIFCTQRNWHTNKMQRSGKSSIDKIIQLDYDLGLLFGYFLAEGNIGFRSGKANLIETVHAKSEYNYVLDIERIVFEKFNTQITKRFKTTDKLTKEGCWIVRICNGILAKLFRHLFYGENYNAFDKNIPNVLLDTNKEFKKGLLEGYWRGDGHLDRSTRLITSARKHLLQSAQQIALSLRKPCGISVHACGKFNSWRLRFANEMAINAPVKFVGDKLFARIRSIEVEEYNDIVYDFEVDDEDHLLMAGTFLVHNSSWEGGRVDRYRKHWYAMMMSGAKDKAMWGSEEAKWAASSFRHPLKAIFSDEFKYRFERENYEDRPYPITGRWGSDIPFIGPAVAATFGKLIKPTRFMHQEEWAGQGGYLHVPNIGTNEPSQALGGIAPGDPVLPTSGKQAVGELAYRMNELRGLTGFMHGAIKEHLTGSQDYFDKSMRLESAERATGAERAYWDLELGGLAGATEAFRRFLPHRRRQIDLYNPIRNTMPDWLPGPNYYKDFQHGDPFCVSAEGELRLPGKGYAALNPDVAGLAPKDYPIFHKYKILSDVALYSDEFKSTRQQVKGAIKSGEIFGRQAEQFDIINRQVSAKKKRRRFSDYKFTKDALQQMKVQVTGQMSPGVFQTKEHGVFGLSGYDMATDQLDAANIQTKATRGTRRKQAQVSDFLREHIYQGAELDVYVHKDELHRFGKGPQGYFQKAAIQSGNISIGEGLVERGLATRDEGSPFVIPGKYSGTQQALGKAWEKVTHYDSPLEYLTPAAPMSKFVRRRSAIEEYERARAYGTESAFWQHPYKNFIRPATTMLGRSLGVDELPENTQRRVETEEYFDKLKWVKYRALELAATRSANMTAASEFTKQQRRTLFGVDPYGSRSYIYSALPSLDRDYYESFAEADSPLDRERILKMIAPNQRPLYAAKWISKAAEAARAKQEMGIATDDSVAQIKASNMSRANEGRPWSEVMQTQYQQEGGQEQSYADWSRSKELQDYFTGKPLPSAQWVGWHPSYDLEDLKLKIIDSTGQDMHEYNLWQGRQRQLSRKPYVQETEEDINKFSKQDPIQITRAVETTLRDVLGFKNLQVSTYPGPPGADDVQIEIQDERKNAMDAYRKNKDFAGIM